MKKGVIGIAIVIALIASFFALSKPEPRTTTAVKAASTTRSAPTNFSQVQAAIASGAQLLDVRTAEEYATGHIEGATNFSLQDLQAGKRPAGSQSQALYVYCHSGNRSGQATAILQNAGYRNVVDLGAITHVESIGGKLVTGS